ncbi:Putative ribosomal protein MRP10 [Septoria linicola]|uniref:Small ribosomal subunit protein mS37 n=1 Tax=Septoria linicola TaxID=215465 RepID=A0A9Q9ANL1_9PEZI|nr:putative ribosomal protein MRP10 [Septoria linicola]USW52594.1 Putative ribosomal protein MRP10 [Septoria linicola]
MVAGKTSKEALARAAQTTAPKLPPLPKLRVRKPDKGEANPCLGIMSSMLGCWASSGYSAAGCAALEQQLRGCMDARKTTQQSKSTINHHLSRFYPQIIGPHKRK